jgi:hypothetical protein
MPRGKSQKLAFGTVLLLALAVPFLPAYALENQTFVASNGNNSNPCTRAQPCFTLSGALAKTNPGGVIMVVDSGSYGAVTINKSISIIAEGVEASILPGATGDNIVVDAGTSDVVKIDGFYIEGRGIGNRGIHFLRGAQLHLRNCLVRGFSNANSGRGLLVQTSTSSRTFVSDCTFHANNVGVLVAPTGGSAFTFLDRVKVVDGFDFGIRTVGAGAVLRFTNSVVTGNAVALQAVNSSKIVSFGNNAIAGNAGGETPTDTISTQ